MKLTIEATPEEIAALESIAPELVERINKAGLVIEPQDQLDIDELYKALAKKENEYRKSIRERGLLNGPPIRGNTLCIQ